MLNQVEESRLVPHVVSSSSTRADGGFTSRYLDGVTSSMLDADCKDLSSISIQ